MLFSNVVLLVFCYVAFTYHICLVQPFIKAALYHMQATKAVKGTLNKLTPEKFERLLQQLVDVVTSAEILHTTISLVFESAVAQPTFVAMYADLCDRLSKVCRPVHELSKPS